MVHNARPTSSSSRTWRIFFGCGVLLLIAFAFAREYVRNMDIASELARLEAENAALQAKQLSSLQLISQLSTETAVEYAARTKLNMAKEGETMYVVSEDETNVVTTSLAEAQRSLAHDSALSNPAKWFYYFFAPQHSEAL